MGWRRPVLPLLSSEPRPPESAAAHVFPFVPFPLNLTRIGSSRLQARSAGAWGHIPKLANGWGSFCPQGRSGHFQSQLCVTTSGTCCWCPAGEAGEAAERLTQQRLAWRVVPWQVKEPGRDPCSFKVTLTTGGNRIRNK